MSGFVFNRRLRRPRIGACITNEGVGCAAAMVFTFAGRGRNHKAVVSPMLII